MNTCRLVDAHFNRELQEELSRSVTDHPFGRLRPRGLRAEPMQCVVLSQSTSFLEYFRKPGNKASNIEVFYAPESLVPFHRRVNVGEAKKANDFGVESVESRDWKVFATADPRISSRRRMIALTICSVRTT
jgi:hypothetical protein